jgi:L-aminopeptidase/D-esterase-like protein
MVGIGMQIVYLGCSATAALEAEAAMQLMRLQPFGASLSDCHLAIEALRLRSGKPLYDVRLDLVTATHELKPIGRHAAESAEEAVRRAFDAAERTLRIEASASAPRR